jgi:signal peptidase II
LRALCFGGFRVKWVTRGIVLAILLASDICSKAWVAANMELYEAREFIPLVRLFYTTNDGAAWSLFRGGRWFFVAVTAAASAVAVYVLIRGMVRHWTGVWGLVFILAGGLGNGMDRLLHGYVIDMFDFTFMRFPIFNVADICITAGAAGLFVYLLFFHEKKPGVPVNISPADGGGTV